MIDAVVIFTKGGLVLWSLELIAVPGQLVDKFIKTCLLEHRSSDNKYSCDGYELRWVPVNRLNAFILVAYKGILESHYISTMLTSLKSKLLCRVSLEHPNTPVDLSADFTRILDKCDNISPVSAPKVHTAVSRSSTPEIAKPKSHPKSKSAREWGPSSKTSHKVIESLDYSKPADAPLLASQQYEVSDNDESSGYTDSDSEAPSGLIGRLVSKVQNITGNAQLRLSDLEPILSSFKTDLMSKNVAEEVAAKIVSSVGKSLEGTRTERFTTVGVTVKQSLERSIEEILTPKKSVDVLKAAMDAKSRNEVFTIAFLGVNGVGKSTNLAKVAYYLKNKGELKVLIAACDTFRSGAVEQLRTHARNLGVELFERGYGKDSADIAKQAIAHAKSNQFDVCLIDTAGRMQDNEPLMRAIGKLVSVNTPDLVLFVGEALVGHDSVDQLEKFNRALLDHAGRPVDGIVLTKYDTVDDKVGAALSMVYVTGQPVVFVGTGQKYPHLRKLQVRDVLKALVG
jgi:signal recognition particle receptor subunit alpha